MFSVQPIIQPHIISYHIFSFIVGVALLCEAIRSMHNMCKLKFHSKHIIEHTITNILISNIIILFLLCIRAFMEAFITGRTGITIFCLAILRVVPPLIYIYMQRIAQSVLIGHYFTKKNKNCDKQ